MEAAPFLDLLKAGVTAFRVVRVRMGGAERVTDVAALAPFWTGQADRSRVE